ncbi:class I fructose-bisphosphate aldolase [Guyparkeria sp.]|uniref:class I fructose-bisphosphate aldolase n=1 Tax=Guyparkeria sp. TaxID=2035736 RepID=UPI0039708448
MTTYRPEKADELIQTARAMVAPGKGILAIDESNGTCNKRFEAVGIDPSEEKRRQYRELLLTIPDLETYVSGAILYDETIRQSTADGKSFIDVMRERGQVVGIKVDTGAKPLAGSDGEKVTEGLDGLRERIAEYYGMGARFAKWRAVITIGRDGRPTRGCIEANAHALARYAALCQEGGLVPIIEPEVLIDGDHDIDTCERVTEEELNEVFRQLYHQNVMLEGVILKTSMVISGKDAASRAGVEEVAERTVETLLRTVPAALGGVVFLSGGQGVEESTAHLNAMHQRHGDRLPWPLTFSYARAIQGPALGYWKGESANAEEAQKRAFKRAKFNGLASEGKYSADMESA